ncbi:uncharacterized protein LOC143067836 [Mytilus galloprovincialis]|uniref:uncharacterized protein LOC143067836 n=1 Tax=Mytilus galloprovincialis TaxID=29158 RepID=UPI003F7BA011
MVGLLYNIIFLLTFHVSYSEENSTILFCNGTDGGFCSKVLQPVEAFYSSKVAILDNTLRSIICPPDDMKLVLFKCTSLDRCDCNKTLEVYEQCFGDKSYCSEQVTSTISTFTYKCNKELKLKCPSLTLPTHKTTSRKSTTTSTLTTTISSSAHVRNTTSKQASTQTFQSTKTSSTKLTTVSKELLPTHIPFSTDREEQKTKDAVIVVLVLSIISLLGATAGMYVYKKRRRRRFQIQQEHGNDVTPTNGKCTYTDENHEQGAKNNTHELCQQSCDSGVVCNVEINHDE